MDSILDTVKKRVGLEPDYDAFDEEIIQLINAALMTLRQLGVGPAKGFFVENDKQTWDDFLGEDNPVYQPVRDYVGTKVKILFDPPSNSTATQALTEHLAELEFRLNIEAEEGGRQDESK